MKKITIYLTDKEYSGIASRIQKFQDVVQMNENDGVYSDEERAEIINTYSSIPYCMKKGMNMKMKEMGEYISQCSAGKGSIDLEAADGESGDFDFS